jgi:hypothetical protein
VPSAESAPSAPARAGERLERRRFSREPERRRVARRSRPLDARDDADDELQKSIKMRNKQASHTDYATFYVRCGVPLYLQQRYSFYVIDKFVRSENNHYKESLRVTVSE